MDRMEGYKLMVSMRKKGHTFAEIGEILEKKGYPGSTQPKTLAAQLERGAPKKKSYKMKSKKWRKSDPDVVLTPAENKTGKVVIMMCDIAQARELLS